VHQRDDVDPRDRARTAFALAQSLWRVDEAPGDRRDATALAERALQEHASAEATRPEEVDAIRSWLRSPGR
jgi:hypothetical protein